MNDRDKNIEPDFANRAKQAFDESVDSLDAATLSKLNRSRHAALAELNNSGSVWLRWMPATGVAAAVLVAVVMLQSPGEIDVINAPASDFEILLGEESIEMLEDLEFYSWLATQELGPDSDFG